MGTYTKTIGSAVGALFLFAVMCAVLAAQGMAEEQASAAGQPVNTASVRKTASDMQSKGNYKEALEQYLVLCRHSGTEPALVGFDLASAVSCLQQLNRESEADVVLEEAVKLHAQNWRLLWAAARIYAHQVNHYGFTVSGNFERGQHRGGGEQANVFERDRVRALQLMDEAAKLPALSTERNEYAQMLLEFAPMFVQGRAGQGAWRLQILTDLSTLPEVESGYPYWMHGRGDTQPGAPVDEQGNPVFHKRPASWEASASDGERWRWLLWRVQELEPGLRLGVMQQQAEFLHNQFGVQTMAEYGALLARMEDGENETGSGENAETAEKDTSGVYAVHTLKDTETIARTAVGIRRFALPDEFNHIKIYKEIVAGGGVYAASHLAQIYENRRQYGEALRWWRAYENVSPDHARSRIRQIEQNWGRLEPVEVQPAGQGATVRYTFRNGNEVSFTAKSLNVELLLSDIKNYLKSNPAQLDWQRLDAAQIGWRIVHENETKYIKDTAASWTTALTPRANHWDRRVTVTTPLQKAGAYLLTARMKDGNESRMILWVQDTVILQKPVKDRVWFYVADAVTGKPLPDIKLDLFGYHQEWVNRAVGSRYNTTTHALSAMTDAAGQVVIEPKQFLQGDRGFQWLITAKTDGGRLAHLGFTHAWQGYWHDAQYNEIKQYLMTDRPVYRPEQAVKWKIWTARAQYDQGDANPFAGQQYRVTIKNPKGDNVLAQDFTADAFGGIGGELALAKDAALGVYSVCVTNPHNEHPIGTFRVEEYKKPEFEVTVSAPEEAVKLGESFEATVESKYYMGLPVKGGKLTYKVLRFEHDARWYPARPWDWFYGPGYWWFCADYPWYPGWSKWGCWAPVAWWWNRPSPQPEVVASGEAVLDEHGKYQLKIDTALAKRIHGDTDHRYEITAEVTDDSRRTITGTGSVLVARQAFKVYAWMDQGYYVVGKTARVEFAARTVGGKGVQGKGKATLYRVTYKEENGDRTPVETAVQEWELNTGEDGTASLQLSASQAGQYRVACRIEDGKGHVAEGGSVFVVRGEGFDGRSFRFSQLELVPDKAEYAAGESVKLMVNTDRAGATVLLFVRPANGAYLPPQVLDMPGKSATVEIPVTAKDMPNFFVEAVTVYGADVHQTVREIVVPPVQRVLNVEVVPDKEAYLPGAEAKVAVKLTDAEGKPFVGSTVLTVYDKAVEYISGGSNVGDIREFFWKWRRQHYPSIRSSLSIWSQMLLKEREEWMQALGVFGDQVADEAVEEEKSELAATKSDSAMSGRRESRMMKAKGGELGAVADACAEAPAPACAPAPQSTARLSLEKDSARPAEGNAAGMGGDAPATVEPVVRTQFADTAFWGESITTDAEGKATVSFKMPENLGGWKFRLWAMGAGTRVGEAAANAVTRKNIMVRLQAPRFIVQKDEVVLSANIHNELDVEKKVEAILELPDGVFVPVPGETLGKSVTIPAHGQQRVDWRVAAVKEGQAVVRMKALTDVESDAMEVTLPSYIHGTMKQLPFSGMIRPDGDKVTAEFVVPEERRPESSRLEVRFSPTLAMAMVDALPYLTEYPYGCTEQTLNKFLPAVIAQKVLLDMGVKLSDVREKMTNLNAQELGDPKVRAEQWKKKRERSHNAFGESIPYNPVYSETVVRDMVQVGVSRLVDMQVSDGGWGWFSGWGERSYPHTTAVVVRGLRLAKDNGAEVDERVIARGVKWLREYQETQIRLIREYEATKGKKGKRYADDLDALIYMILVDGGVDERRIREYLYRDRNELSVYAKCAFGIACHRVKDTEKRDMLIRNVTQYLVRDAENQTAYLNLGNDGYWWCWYGSEYEAHAFYLKLLAATEPSSEVAPELVKYLLNNRKHATYWNSTRDTAVVIEAFADYIRATKEDDPEMTVQVMWDGQVKKEVMIRKENLFTFDNAFTLVGEEVTGGKHTLELRRKGKGPLYANAYCEFFTLEDDIKKAGLEVKVERAYYRLKRVETKDKAQGAHGQAVDQTVEKYEREPLKNLDELKSGELAEVEMTIASKNDYEYVLVEDYKPAGFEPLEVRSGYNGNEMGAYVEFRDERVSFFVQRLARGTHSVSYRLRAEIPGRFSALPAKAWAMYAPELKANSDEIKLNVKD